MKTAAAVALLLSISNAQEYCIPYGHNPTGVVLCDTPIRANATWHIGLDWQTVQSQGACYLIIGHQPDATPYPLFGTLYVKPIFVDYPWYSEGILWRNIEVPDVSSIIGQKVYVQWLVTYNPTKWATTGFLSNAAYFGIQGG